MYEAGKSLRQIAAETFIDHSAIGKMAKKEGWERIDGIPQLIQDAVSVEARKSTLLPQQLDIVDKAVEKQLEGMQFYNTHARIVAKKAVDSLNENMVPMTARQVMQTLKDGMVVEGLVPYYPNAQTINNTNAQQNNSPSEMLKEIAERLPV